MILNEKIKAYLKLNNISYEDTDYQTGFLEGQPEEILLWKDKLGQIPNQTQLDQAFSTDQSNEIARQKALDDAKSSALAKLSALGLTLDEINAITK